jgi:long-chain acyl-CoA synthetase
MNSALFSGLVRNGRERASEPAVREVGAGGVRTFSWEELVGGASALARRLEADGPSAGPVLVCGGNRFEVLASLLAGLWSDAWVAPVAPETPVTELRALASDVAARAVVASPEILSVLERHVALRIDLEEATRGKAERFVPPAGTGAGSILLRSSGTTGPPKIVRRDAPALDAVGNNCRATIGVSASDVMLLAIPVYHSYGIDMGLLSGVPAGALLELHERFDVASVRRSLAERGVTVFPGVPVMLDALARGAGGPLAAPRLRRVVSAGSPLAREVAERFTQVYGVPIGQIYGATEFGSVAYNAPESWEAAEGSFRPECVGRAFGDVRIRVVDGEDPAHVIAAGEEGQIAVASDSMLVEYLGDEGPATRDGFLLTGDLGRVDAHARIELTGRLKLMVDVGGMKVNPLEVESVLRGYPGVLDVVAIPIPYSATASRLKAIIIPEPGVELDREEIRSFAREHLIHYKVPRSFEITDDVPRSPSGKILRQQLMTR